MHLPGIGVGEPAELQIKDDEAAQAALTADEGEVVAEFEQEGFEAGFGVFVAQAKEFEN
jgi:hypothetical protein